MKEFKLSPEREELLFTQANNILDKRKRKKDKQQKIKEMFSLKEYAIELKIAPLLIPTVAAIVVLLLSAPTIEFDGDFIDLGTTITDFEDIQGE